MAALRSAAKRIVERNPNSPGWPVMERSIMGPYSKIWVYGDSKPFLDAPQGEFAPRRWAERTHTVWLRAPLPQHAAIDLKGTWLSDNDRSYQVDPLKADRDEEVYKKEGA